MSKRFWLLGLVGLVLVAMLVACGTNYSSSSDGLVVVGSRGSGLLETFGFNLNTGGVSPIANTPADTSSLTCVLNGEPSSIVMDPAGMYAYTIINSNSSCNTQNTTSKTGLAAFKVNSNGNLAQVGSLIALNPATVVEAGVSPATTEPVAVVPSTMSVDAAGKFLFVADRATTDSAQRSVPGAVSVFAIGSGGSLTEVAGSPFFTITPVTTQSQASLDFVSVAATPTVFPGIGINGTQNSTCSVGSNRPTSEYLYAVDTLGYQLLEFQVDTSSGALTLVTSKPPIATNSVPAGIAVDPCDRFVYVSDSLTNKISAYLICTVVIQGTCPIADGSLVEVAGSPFVLSGSANGPGPIVVDPYGNNVYVVGTLSNTVSAFKISAVSGGLTALTPPTVNTGLQPTSMAIRGDDNWLFVTNYNAATVSQYSITPATGALTVLPTIQTDNYPWGVAVK